MTNAEFAILSLIVEQSRHGYEIEQVIEERGMRNWTEVGFSSIYYLLKKLEKAGLIIGQTQVTEGRGPARKVFNATQAGIDACQTATFDALSTPHRCYPPIQLGLSNLPNIPLDEAITALTQHRNGLRERVTAVEASRATPHPDHAALMYSYSITTLTAQISWLSDVIQQLETQKL